MSETSLYDFLKKLYSEGRIKQLDLHELIKKQLLISKNFLKSKDELDIRIGIILADNVLEILFRNIFCSITDEDEDGKTTKRKTLNFEDLINKCLGKKQTIHKFIIFFMHKLRNNYYHLGVPRGVKYALKTPNLLVLLSRWHFNLICEILKEFERFLPVLEDYKKEKYISDINLLQFDGINEKEKQIALKAILEFFIIKWEILTKMVDFIVKISNFKHPDLHFKWTEFWEKNKNKKYEYNNFKNEFEKFKSKFKYKELVEIGSLLEKSINTLEKNCSVENIKLASLLTKVNKLLEKYENEIFPAFLEAEDVLELRIKENV